MSEKREFKVGDEVCYPACADIQMCIDTQALHIAFRILQISIAHKWEPVFTKVFELLAHIEKQIEELKKK
jgi:hypothetical protein